MFYLFILSLSGDDAKWELLCSNFLKETSKCFILLVISVSSHEIIFFLVLLNNSWESSPSQSLQLPVQLLEKDKHCQMTVYVIKTVAENSSTHSAGMFISLYCQITALNKIPNSSRTSWVRFIMNANHLGCIQTVCERCSCCEKKKKAFIGRFENIDLILQWASTSRLPVRAKWSLTKVLLIGSLQLLFWIDTRV